MGKFKNGAPDITVYEYLKLRHKAVTEGRKTGSNSELHIGDRRVSQRCCWRLESSGMSHPCRLVNLQARKFVYRWNRLIQFIKKFTTKHAVTSTQIIRHALQISYPFDVNKWTTRPTGSVQFGIVGDSPCIAVSMLRAPCCSLRSTFQRSEETYGREAWIWNSTKITVF
jgi:hypothetical protein